MAGTVAGDLRAAVTHLCPQGMSVQLHVPYSEHAKAPVGPITMGLPLAVDPKKLGKGLDPDPGPTWLRLSMLGVGADSGVQQLRGAASLLRDAGSPLSLLPPAPFSGVKQEQLSPRAQAGPPESLGVPTAQETSVLRGEALRRPPCPALFLSLQLGRSRPPRSFPSPAG